MKNILSIFTVFIISTQIGISQHYYTDSFTAQKADNYIIDGNGDETFWNDCQWYDLPYIWIPYGGTMSAGDFSGRVKFAWTNDKLLILAEIEDNVLSDTHTDPQDNYWNDDCFEVFLDEDYSGGWHQTSYNAFAYHCAINEKDVIDIGTGGGVNLKDHIEFDLDTTDATHYTWELAITIYDDTYAEGNSINNTVSLIKNKEMGIAVAYCDNDGGTQRENFIGLIDVAAEHFNSAWQDASVFGKLILNESGGEPDAIKGHSFTDDIQLYQDENLELVIEHTGSVLGSTLLSIYDLNGRLIQASNIFLEDKASVGIESIKTGLYIITVRNENFNYSGIFYKN